MFFEFSPEKSRILKKERNITFEEIITEIEDGENVLDIVPHTNREKYPNQFMFIVRTKGYIYAVPFVKITESKVFLKTIFPDRRLLKKYNFNS